MRKRIAIYLKVKGDKCNRYFLVLFVQNPFLSFSKKIIYLASMWQVERTILGHSRGGLICLLLSQVQVVNPCLNSHVPGHRAWFSKGHTTPIRA